MHFIINNDIIWKIFTREEAAETSGSISKKMRAVSENVSS